MNSEDKLGLIASSPEYKARFDTVKAQQNDIFKKKYNVEATDLDLLDSPAVMIFVLAGELSGDMTAEIENRSAAVQNAKKGVELQAALSDPENSEHDKMLCALNSLPPHQRMQKAREMGLEGNSMNDPVATVHDPSERARIIAEINKLPLSMRISAARARGVA